MSDSDSRFDLQNDQLSRDMRVNQACNAFELQWQAGKQPRIESYCDRAFEADRPDLLRELISLELELRQDTGQPVETSDYYRRFPKLPTVVEAALHAFELAGPEADDRMPDAVFNSRSEDAQSAKSQSAKSQSDIAAGDTMPQASSDYCTANADDRKRSGHPSTPTRIGRFVISKILGQGGFGRVYLARDSQMDRLVALKVPNPSCFMDGESVEMFLQEARNAAQLRHPGLVTVHDVQTNDNQPYLVQEYIPGTNLTEWLSRQRPAVAEAVRIVIEVVEALLVVHQHNLVHRDLKPANILIDEDAHAHVADFGLAIHASSLTRRLGEVVGSPAYMSPEQVRGETNRVDGRTDIWSVGVVMYELLVGALPFQGRTTPELFHAIQFDDPWPPSQRKPDVPRELDRICLSCLTKLKSERYTSMASLLEDLRQWYDGEPNDGRGSSSPRLPNRDQRRAPQPKAASNAPAEAVPSVVPKGLQAFGHEDADFFLQMLPGIPNRDGLPPSVGFWKSRIEKVDGKPPFTVATMYGPSGCGKSSLLRAGVLPRLSANVRCIFVEATAEGTETRMLSQLAPSQKTTQATQTTTDLPTAVRDLRERTTSHSVLIVIDQFEQWLSAHAAAPQNDEALLNALRQCDGDRVQALLLVRDDFWMPISRLFRQLETPMLEGVNCAAVDLFSVAHAEKVLTSFGRAYGRLEEAELTAEQQTMVRSAVAGLASDGKLIPVRLALFAEMLKDVPWSPLSLRKLGGTEGVGVAFLEETFHASTAPASHRQHEQAVRGILEVLLPETGRDIRVGAMPRDRLLAASGYDRRPDDFTEVLDILCRVTRLITLTQRDGPAQGTGTGEPTAVLSEAHYQLTHDYLVPSIRAWLTREKQATRRGRAALRLAERTALWRERPDLLPTLWEYFQLISFSRARTWTSDQRTMLNQAGRRHLSRAVFVGIALLSLGGLYYRFQWNATYRGLVTALETARPTEVVDVTRKFQELGPAALTRLQPTVSDRVEESPRARLLLLHRQMALVALDPQQHPSLLQHLLASNSDYLRPLLELLTPHQAAHVEALWGVARDPREADGRRFNSLVALAQWASDDPAWGDATLAPFLATQLVTCNPDDQSVYRDLVRPVAKVIKAELVERFRLASRPEAQLAAANALVDLHQNDEPLLARLICEANEAQFKLLRSYLEGSVTARSVWTELTGETPELADDQVAKATASSEDSIGLAVRRGAIRARAAINLLLSRETKLALHVFHTSPAGPVDPEPISQFVRLCRSCGVSAAQLVEALAMATEPNAVYAIVLALGNYDRYDLSDQEDRCRELLVVHAVSQSSNVSAGTRWLMKQWNLEPESADVSPSPDENQADIRTATQVAAMPEELSIAFGESRRLAMQFVVFRSPAAAANHAPMEADRSPPIPSFAISQTEVPVGAWLAFQASAAHWLPESYYKHWPRDEPSAAHPVRGVNWYAAVEFCRWLTYQAGMRDEDQCYADPALLSETDHANIASGFGQVDWPCDVSKAGFRLPLEIEWELACRAGTTTAFSFGDDATVAGDYATFDANSDARPSVCGSRRPNLRGLFDMHGNVLEWCQDRTPNRPEFRMNRGGSYGNQPANLTSKIRTYSIAAERKTHYGFRVMRRIDP